MLETLKKLFKDLFKSDTENRSRNAANDRLRIVLTNDRLNLSQETLDAIREEIIEVIARHTDIAGTPEVNIITEGRKSAVDISIPLKSKGR